MDEEAGIVLRWVSLDEAIEAVLDGRLHNGILMIALLACPCPTRLRPLERQLDRYLRHLAIERGRSVNTVAAYRRDLNALLGALGDAAMLGVLEPPALAAYVRGLRERPEPLAASSIARTISSIRGFMRFLVDEGLIETDPSADLVAPKQPARLPKALTIEQVEQLLAATDGDDPASLRDKALVELLLRDGCAHLGGRRRSTSTI